MLEIERIFLPRKAPDAETWQRQCWWASTIRVKFPIATTNALKLIELARLLHVDFRSGFGTVFQGVHRVFTLPGDR
jgi:hypothetical protein